MPKKLPVLLLLCFLMLQNCATIVSKTSFPVRIDSDPQAATVVVTDKKGNEIYRRGTPAHIKLKSGQGYFSKGVYTIRIEKPGYQPAVTTIKAVFNPWYIGNIVFGGFLGLLVVDPLTGAMYKIRDLDVRESLVPLSSTSLMEQEFRIIMLEDLPSTCKNRLVKYNTSPEEEVSVK